MLGDLSRRRGELGPVLPGVGRSGRLVVTVDGMSGSGNGLAGRGGVVGGCGIFVDEFVEDVALAGDVAGFLDGAADLVEGEVVDGARGGDDVFLEHEGAHVVGAEEEADLADLGALCDPGGLDVGDIIEEEA